MVGNIAEGVGENKTLCCLGSLAALYFLPIAHLGIRIYLRNKLRDQKGIEVCMQISFDIYIAIVTECEPMQAMLQYKYSNIYK